MKENCHVYRFIFDVCLLRLILILLLVFYHSFCVFCGEWYVPDGFPQNEIYWWMAKVSISFFLEVFAFISGYLFGNVVRSKGVRILTFDNCVVKKIKRLIIPSIVFSVLYFLLMGNYNVQPMILAVKILNGWGHLWYLPMLFWCFVAIWIIEKIKIKPQYVVPLLFIGAIFFSIKNLPLRIDDAIYYMPFFYVGYAINRYSVSLDSYFKWKNVLLFGAVYVTAFVCLHVFNRQGALLSGDSFVVKMANGSWEKLSHVVYSSAALITVYLAANTALKTDKIRVGDWMIRLSGLCYGVYIYHQMIIDFAYYRLGWLEQLPSLLLPWVGFGVALSLSLFLAWITLKTRVGRFLIG